MLFVQNGSKGMSMMHARLGNKYGCAGAHVICKCKQMLHAWYACALARVKGVFLVYSKAKVEMERGKKGQLINNSTMKEIRKMGKGD
jgi:hypothetical protein